MENITWKDIEAVALHGEDLERMVVVLRFVQGLPHPRREEALEACRKQLAEAKHVVRTLAPGTRVYACWKLRRDVLAKLVMATDLAAAETDEDRLVLEIEAAGDVDLGVAPAVGLGAELELDAYCEAGVGA